MLNRLHLETDRHSQSGQDVRHGKQQTVADRPDGGQQILALSGFDPDAQLPEDFARISECPEEHRRIRVSDGGPGLDQSPQGIVEEIAPGRQAVHIGEGDDQPPDHEGGENGQDGYQDGI